MGRPLSPPNCADCPTTSARRRGAATNMPATLGLGDGRCGVDLDGPAYSAAGLVAAAAVPWLLTASGLGAFPDGWCDGGLLSWTSGANSGRVMEVKRFTRDDGTSRVELWRSMADAIAPGDAFTISAGCDKTYATCGTKFANGVNFRGFPHMPGNRYVLAYPTAGDANNDGGSRQ